MIISQICREIKGNKLHLLFLFALKVKFVKEINKIFIFLVKVKYFDQMA